MSVFTKTKTRPVLHATTAVALLVASAYLTVELRENERARTPAAPTLTDGHHAPQGAGNDDTQQGPANGQRDARSWERLHNPDRSVLRGHDGVVLATFTDGARTATLTGPTRTFSEPTHTNARVVTDDWVRLLPKPWTEGAERRQWFRQWFERYFGSERDDVFAYAFQYVDSAPRRTNRDGVPYAGDADFGPPVPGQPSDSEKRLQGSDFYDYLGVPHTFDDGVTARPDKRRHRAMDCSGYLRTVFGYRAGYPMRSSDGSGRGLPRTVDALARSDLGTDVIPLRGAAPRYDRPDSVDTLQPGDLVFFWLREHTRHRMDHTGIYVGRDAEGHQVFVSSRAEANGPTIGDTGGASRLDGEGFYATHFRAAKRL